MFNVSNPSTPFPTLFTEDCARWCWPAPPFSWRHQPVPGVDQPQPCLIEVQPATTVAGEMLGFDPVARTLTFRTSPRGAAVSLSFARFRRLTMTEPLRPAERGPGVPPERVPSAAQEREYRLYQSSESTALTGRTTGHVETAEGLYLFTPVDEEASLQRVFVPRSAYARCEFGSSAEEAASRRWIASPRELLEAIEHQQRNPVLPLGQSLLELGLVTPGQLNRALSQQTGNVPLGESLVAIGIISRGDLQTALAHKMGYPLVDLTRFPIEPAATAKLPRHIATSHWTVPLMLHEDQLIVAVDKPSRVTKLRALHAYAQAVIVPVLASRLQVLLALDRLSRDVWLQHVPERTGFFATTS